MIIFIINTITLNVDEILGTISFHIYLPQKLLKIKDTCSNILKYNYYFVEINQFYKDTNFAIIVSFSIL